VLREIFPRAQPALVSYAVDMLIWLLALVLIGGFAALGMQLGGIRAAVSLLGAVAGLALAPLIGGWIAPILPKLGVVTYTWLLVTPVIIGFTLVWLVSIGASFAAHKPVELHFKYREDDTTREAFERMNHAIGLFLGMLTGVFVFFAVGKPVYSKGYLTTQTANESEPAPIGYVNSLRTGMAPTGWDKTFAALDRTSPKFIAVSDLLGLIYTNPGLTNRLAEYPPFLALVERPEIADLFADADYQKLLHDQAGFSALINNPKTQALLNNTEFTDALAKTDLKDLQTYLESGKSPKYDDERLLGRWRTDMSIIITDARRRRANMPLTDLKNLRFALNALLTQATLTVYPDGRFALRVPPPQLPANFAAAAAPAAATPAPAAPALDPALAARYGLRRGAPAAAAGATPAAPVNPTEMFNAMVAKVLGESTKGGVKLPDFSTEGTWLKNGDRYQFTFKTGSKEEVHEATLQENGRLIMPLPEHKLTLAFERLY
jgi:hypothetical protein